MGCAHCLFLLFAISTSVLKAQESPTPFPTVAHSIDAGTKKRALEFWRKGNALADKGFMDRAREYWQIALELDPGLSHGNEPINPASNFDTSDATLFRTTDVDKQRHISTFLKDAQKAYGQKNYEKASSILVKAESVSPQEPPVEALREKIILENFISNPDRPYNDLVKSDFEEAARYYRNGHYDLALESVGEAQKIDPANPQVLDLKKMIAKKNETALLTKDVERAREQWKEGNGEIALEILSETALKNPDFQLALDLKAQIEDDIRNKEAGQAKVILSRAQKEEGKNQFDEAQRDYRKILDLSPQNKTALEGLSRVSGVADALQDKIRSLEKAVQAEQKEKAKYYWNEIRKMSPENPNLDHWKREVDALPVDTVGGSAAKADEAYNIGLESYRKGDLQSAKKFWSAALELDPKQIQAKRNLERLLEEHPELKKP